MLVNIGAYPDYVPGEDNKRVEEIHIDEFDVWSLDHTLALIILPCLKMLKESKQGAPFVDNEDVPEELRMDDAAKEGYDKEGKTDPKFFKRWDYVLDEMIWAFGECLEDSSGKFHTGEHDNWSQPLDKDHNPIGEPFKSFLFDSEGEEEERKEDPNIKFYQMVKGPNDTSKFDADGYRAHAARIQAGTTLFGKYYKGLWD